MASFRVSDQAEWLNERRRSRSVGTVAREALDRYRGLLAEELRRLHLTAGQARLLWAAARGRPLDPGDPRELVRLVRDGLGAAPLNPDEAAELLDRLETLCPGTRYALIDAIETFPDIW